MILDDLATYLTSNGITSVFKARMPDQPDDAVCLYEYGGSAPARTHSGTAWRNPSVQVAVRSTSYPTARTKIEAIYLLIGGLLNDQLGATMVLNAIPNQEPFPLGPVDSQNRVRLICNFNLAVQ